MVTVMRDQRVIVVGDIHGTLDEFDELLKKVEYRSGPGRSGDRLILLGDLVDRGPDPVGCVRRAKELGCEIVKGNHEVKHLNARKKGRHREVFSRWPERVKQHEELAAPGHDGQSLLDWIDTWPFFIRIEPNLVAVHAGFEPNKAVEDQTWEACVYTRYLDGKTLKRTKLTDDFFPDGTAKDGMPWMHCWFGEDVVYGHIVWSMDKVKETTQARKDGWTFTWGLDTGGCFGGHLTAAVWEPTKAFPEYVQVKAKAVYSKLWYPPPE
jgi:hypothetical protein